MYATVPNTVPVNVAATVRVTSLGTAFRRRHQFGQTEVEELGRPLRA